MTYHQTYYQRSGIVYLLLLRDMWPKVNLGHWLLCFGRLTPHRKAMLPLLQGMLRRRCLISEFRFLTSLHVCNKDVISILLLHSVNGGYMTGFNQSIKVNIRKIFPSSIISLYDIVAFYKNLKTHYIRGCIFSPYGIL